MSNIASLKLDSMIFMLIVSAAFALAACGTSAEPQNRQIDFDITDGKLTMESDTVQVNQGDQVTLLIDSNEHGSVHLHGYDIEKDVGPDGTTPLEFTASATGRFTITFHPGGEDDGHSHEGENGEHDAHADLFESDTLANGESFSFDLPDDLHDAEIPFHNHMDHQMTGLITISEDAGLSGTIEIQVGEDAFEPHEVEVKPGSTIVWISGTEDRVRVASGKAPEAADENSDEHEDEGEEITLGALEVRPR